MNASVTAEEAHPSHARDAFLQPSFLILERLIDKLVGLDIAVEVIGNEIVVAVLNDGVAESREAAGVSKASTLDSLKHLVEIGVELEISVIVGMAEVFDIFCQVSKEENIGFANFSRDFNLLVQ